MKLIRLLLQNSLAIVTLAVFMGLLSGVSSAGLIAVINLTLKNNGLPTAPLAYSFAGLCCLLLIATTASQILVARLVQGVIFHLQMVLNQRILACPLRHLEEIGSHRLLAALTEDVEAVSSASISISTLFVNLALFAGCLIYLCWLSTFVFLLMLVVAILGIFSYQILVNHGRHAFKLAREEQDRLFRHFRTTTEGTKELKLHRLRRLAFLSEDLKSAAASFRQHRVRGMTIFSIAGSWGLLLIFIPIGLLIFGLPHLTTIPMSVMFGYSLTLIFLITPLDNILNSVPTLSRADIALEKIESLGLSLASQNTEQDLNHADSESCCTSLELRGVTHAYRGEREASNFTLGPIHLTFHSGELIFIVGGNGSGKSTLVKLITGLYTPESGEIKLDGKAINGENREWYRQQFSVVFSDFYLFERLLGLDNPDLDTTTQNYLIQLQLEHKVEVRNGMLSSTALSQGQRKRLALLTAYLENRPIYVFDEWASDQDPVFKEIFYTQLLRELKNRGKTVLVVSHDDRYFDRADRVVKLDYGKVILDKGIQEF